MCIFRDGNYTCEIIALSYIIVIFSRLSESYIDMSLLGVICIKHFIYHL
jgi:hypothetical protein